MGLFLKNQQPDLQCITNYVIVSPHPGNQEKNWNDVVNFVDLW